ncbi:unnamed protein product [Cuscuta epithymum]|uniref:Cyclin-like domain-containing protein n=2 Tax=Cuscuta epithymum TaxID=186058 RepID=A0AAV0DVY5_9ASTE|nr:unnamed protein product [Cuscuta epithymum]
MGNPPFSPSALFCTESGSGLNDEGDDSTLISGEDEDEDDEYIQVLLDKETSINGGFPKLDLSQDGNESWVQEARSDAIHYTLKTGGAFGFGMRTVYLSITYLDRFLSRRTIDRERWWAIRLLGIACLSLAAKMEESRVPALTEYPPPMENLFTFESTSIQRMELLVLNTLDWKLRFITPFSFTPYFLSKFITPHSHMHRKSSILSTTMDIIFNAIRDAKLMSHMPSVLAAAATLLALDGGLVKEGMEVIISALPSGGCLNIDDVFWCYKKMKELERDKKEFPKNCGLKRKRSDDT